MKLCQTTADLQEEVALAKAAGKSIGLVPTMGALHEGHGSLITAARKENELVIVSVFVNPTQFGPGEDLEAYPRTLEADCILAGKMGADIVFAPAAKEMYPSADMTWVEVTGDITKVLCGRSRPIHFRGVTTIVSKLFNLAQPDRAYFGQKDAQQVQVIKRMVKDLFFNVQLRIMPIVREADGLAKSSRNTYLSQEERTAGLILSKSLRYAEELFKQGERDSSRIAAETAKLIGSEPLSDRPHPHRQPCPCHRSGRPRRPAGGTHPIRIKRDRIRRNLCQTSLDLSLPASSSSSSSPCCCS